MAHAHQPIHNCIVIVVKWLTWFQIFSFFFLMFHVALIDFFVSPQKIIIIIIGKRIIIIIIIVLISHDNFISFKIQNVHRYAIFVTHIIETRYIGRMLQKWTLDCLFSVRMYIKNNNLFNTQYSYRVKPPRKWPLWRFDLGNI